MAFESWQLTTPEDFLERTSAFDCYRMVINADSQATQLVAPSNKARKSILITNLGIGTVYIGRGNYITPTSFSYPLQSGDSIILDHTVNEVYAIAASGAQEIAVLIE
jgi:hypothetical protein